MEIIKSILSWFSNLFQISKEEDAIQVDVNNLVTHLAEQLSYQWLFVDEVLVRHAQDEHVLTFKAKYPAASLEEDRNRFCSFLLYAASVAGEIEVGILSQEFASAHRLIIDRLPEEYKAFYQNLLTLEEIVSLPQKAMYVDKGSLQFVTVSPTEEMKEENRKYFLEWERLDPMEDSAVRHNEIDMLTEAFVVGRLTFRFRKRLDRNGNNQNKKDSPVPQFGLMPGFNPV